MASVIVAGATGAIGRTVVQHAIRQPSISRVFALTRSANVTEANYEQLFGVTTHVPAAGASKKEHATGVVMVTALEAAKIQPITMDWEAFTTSWAATTAAATAAAAPEAADPFAQYKEMFSGHTYAAMCLGTTRKDAGSAEKFIRCDYDYVIAFTEAVLTYSAPAGFDLAGPYIHHINDGTEVKTTEAAKAATPPAAPAASGKSTGTLRAFCQISAGGADSNGWLLYTRTKGSADEATVERIRRHNTLAAKAGAVAPILLFLLRPGLLHRHDKSRWVEKVAKVVVPSMPVETCGAAVVGAFVEPQLHPNAQGNPPLTATAQATKDAQGQAKASKGESTVLLGTPFKVTKVMKKAGVPHDEDFPYVYELSNSNIKHLAARLPDCTASTAESP